MVINFRAQMDSLRRRQRVLTTLILIESGLLILTLIRLTAGGK